uniref:methanethiol S-methyltransferase n=1 Tax=Schlesneria paludicola TaxID=360056 RepID=A0A7C2K3P1_9PLAN
MKRSLVLLAAGLNYAMFLGVFLYAVGFIGSFLTPTRLDGPAAEPWPQALAINLLLVLTFGLQHSLMARPAFKRWLARFVPMPMERGVYMLATNLALALLFWQWRPMGAPVWDVTAPAARMAVWSLFACGWLTVLATTFLINHFDLFGLRQAWLYFRGRDYSHLAFATPGPYQIVRHPLYVGWLVAFWATPTMGLAHFLFALGMTAYILTAIPFEERNLVNLHGEPYEAYRRRVPMLIPRLRWTATTSPRGKEAVTAASRGPAPQTLEA